jgi:hypothetical protein
VHAQPSSLERIRKDEQNTLNLVIAPHASSTLGTLSGSIQLQRGTVQDGDPEADTDDVRDGGKILPQPLRVSVVLAGHGVSLIAPQGYHTNAQVVTLGGPILLNNFGSQYDHGGLVPPGGAEITITSSSLPQVPLSQFISTEFQGATITSTAPTTVSGMSCTEVSYTDSYGPNLNYSEIAVYCPSTTALSKFYLFYRSGDAGANQFLGTFQQVLNTVQLTL